DAAPDVTLDVEADADAAPDVTLDVEADADAAPDVTADVEADADAAQDVVLDVEADADAAPDVTADVEADADEDANEDADSGTDADVPPVCPSVVVGTPVYPPEVLAFRQGDADYTWAEDLHLAAPANAFHLNHAAAQFATDPGLPWFAASADATRGFTNGGPRSGAQAAGSGDQVGLLRFGRLIGAKATQIPPGAQMTSAKLTLVRAAGTNPVTLHRAGAWTSTTRWADFGPTPGPQPGEDFAGDYAAYAVGGSVGTDVLDVTGDVQAFADGDDNHGWALLQRGEIAVTQVEPGLLGTIAEIRVALQISTPARGDLVVTLHHGDRYALLLDRIGRPSCLSYGSVTDGDLDVILRDDATLSIHNQPKGVLQGSFRPDNSCLSRPLCKAPSGFCGQAATGRWWLELRDEFNSLTTGTKLTKASLEIVDTDGKVSVHPFSTVEKVLNRSHGEQQVVWYSSEAEPASRPRLEVELPAALRFEDVQRAVLAPSQGPVETSVRIRLPPGAEKVPNAISLSVQPQGLVQLPACPTPVGDGNAIVEVPITIVGAGTATLTASAPGLQSATMTLQVGATTAEAEPASLHLETGESATLRFRPPRGMPAGDFVVSTADPALAKVSGAGALTVPAGGANDLPIAVTVTAGAKAGVTTISLVDPSGTLVKTQVPVQVSAVPLRTYDRQGEPFWVIDENDTNTGTVGRLGFHAVVRERGGPAADTFRVRWRDLPNGNWQDLPEPSRHLVIGEAWTNFRVSVPRPAAGTDRVVQIQQLRDKLPHGPAQTLPVRAAATDASAWRVALVGNHGLGNDAAFTYLASLKGSAPDLVIANGDVAYDHGEWYSYPTRALAPLAPVLASATLAIGLGNHGVQTEQGAPLVGILRPPLNNGPADAPPGRNYAFDFGTARFFVVNTSTTWVEPSVSDWLVAGLQASKQKWNIVVTHETPYTHPLTVPDRQGQPGVRKGVLAAAIQGGADLLLGGSCHSYQRYYPVTAVPESGGGITTAACENGPGVLMVYSGSTTWFRAPAKTPPSPLPAPLAAYHPAIGHARLTFVGDTVTVEMVAPSGVVLDSLVRKRCTAAAPCTCP
ncbi:MAG: hypothetical protein RIT45_409, partial [Pseudomonadota bacterium]